MSSEFLFKENCQMSKINKVYGDKADSLIRSYLSRVQNCVYKDSYKYAYTHQKIMNLKNDFIYNDSQYKTLPDWAGKVFFFAESQMFHVWQSKHIWTHLYQNERINCHNKKITDYSLIDCDLSYHCYGFYINDKVVYLPINEDDRQKEIQSGRINQETVDLISKNHRGEISCVSYEDNKLKYWKEV